MRSGVLARGAAAGGRSGQRAQCSGDLRRGVRVSRVPAAQTLPYRCANCTITTTTSTVQYIEDNSRKFGVLFELKMCDTCSLASRHVGPHSIHLQRRKDFQRHRLEGRVRRWPGALHQRDGHCASELRIRL